MALMYPTVSSSKCSDNPDPSKLMSAGGVMLLREPWMIPWHRGIGNNCSQLGWHVNGGNTFHRFWHRENPNTRFHLQRNKTNLSKSPSEPLMPSEECVHEAITLPSAVSTHLPVPDSTNSSDPTVGQRTTYLFLYAGSGSPLKKASLIDNPLQSR